MEKAGFMCDLFPGSKYGDYTQEHAENNQQQAYPIHGQVKFYPEARDPFRPDLPDPISLRSKIPRAARYPNEHTQDKSGQQSCQGDQARPFI